MSDNPLLQDFNGPFGLPPFDQIMPAHVPVAVDAAMATHNDEIAAIVNDPAAPTFANTIEALERAGRDLTRVLGVFFNLASADTNPELQALERQLSPRLASHWSAITANAGLFARVDALFQAIDTLGLDAVQRRLLERTHLGFVRSGAELDDAGKARMAEINERLASLGTTFSQNVLAEEAAFELKLTAPDDLEGLPSFLIEAAAATAQERGSDASHVMTLSRSLIEPFLTFSTRRDLREAGFRAWTARGANGNDHDNRDIVAEILSLRDEKARLLGFDDFTAFKLDDSMAQTPAAVRALLSDVWTPAVARAREEADALEAFARQTGANITIEPWDWRFYAEKVRKARYDVDEADVKPYLQLDKMIEAAFHTAHRLFGLSFVAQPDLKLYHPDVRAWEVRDRNGGHVGLFLGDHFARASKRSGAWMSAYRGQWRLDGEVRPIIVNVCNFAKAPAGTPTLLSFDDARTLFHEFGHALHGLLSDVTYPSMAGTSVARDFVELPSQLFEHWLESDEILSRFAIHCETGAAMPDDLRQRLVAARNFNQGFATVEYLASAMVDIEMHANAAEAARDPIGFQAAVLERLGMPREIVMRHAAPHFLHLFAGGGYASGYYSYMWSEVLDSDAFRAFEETGDVFAPEIAEKLRTFVLSAGGSRDERDAYVAFRGRMPDVSALLEKRGLADAA